MSRCIRIEFTEVQAIPIRNSYELDFEVVVYSIPPLIFDLGVVSLHGMIRFSTVCIS